MGVPDEDFLLRRDKEEMRSILECADIHTQHFDMLFDTAVMVVVQMTWLASASRRTMSGVSLMDADDSSLSPTIQISQDKPHENSNWSRNQMV